MNDCFSIKTTPLHCSILLLRYYDRQTFERHFLARVTQAPLMFKNTAMILDTSRRKTVLSRDDIHHIRCYAHETCQTQLIGLQEPHNDAQACEAAACGLAIIPNRTDPNSAITSHTFEPKKIIYQRVRTGQQIYAEHTDLIIMNDVAPGAEVIADGDIHIYGTLSGKAIAGAQNQPKARLFCQHFHAELVAIAGIFITADAISNTLIGQAITAHINDDSLQLSPMRPQGSVLTQQN